MICAVGDLHNFTSGACRAGTNIGSARPKRTEREREPENRDEWSSLRHCDDRLPMQPHATTAVTACAFVRLRRQGRSPTAMSASGKQQAAREVIQDWADGEGGYTFERGRMEAAIRDLCFDNTVSVKKPDAPAKSANGKPNREDVDFIVSVSGRESAHGQRSAATRNTGCSGRRKDVRVSDNSPLFHPPRKTKELAIPRSEAEEVLAVHQGDVTNALIQLMTPAI